MRPDEKPDDLVIAFAHTDRAIRVAHAYGPDRQIGIQALELKTWMVGVGLKATISRTSAALDFLRQLFKFTP